MPNVIRVSIYHHKGAQSRGPHFQLATQEVPDIQIRETNGDATLTSGRLSVNVRKGEWQVHFKADETDHHRQRLAWHGHDRNS